MYLDPAIERCKSVDKWYSHRLNQETQLIRWGTFGKPLLLFPTAGGDAAEVERFYLIRVLEPLLLAGKIKVYSIDSVAGKTWLTNDNVAHCVWIQKQFDNYLREEVFPAIRYDCRSDWIEMLVAGASIGAFNALLAICRHPDVFSHAICMSGTYDLQKWLQGQWFDDFHHYSPLHFLPSHPEDERMHTLRSRMVYLPTGQGRYEDPGESWKVAHALGSRAVPNRVDLWDPSWDHDWTTWREMLPKYVEESLGTRS